MTGRITNRLRILLAEKATREQHSIAINDVQRETGIAWSTLNSWAYNQATRYDAPMIKALCQYFNYQVVDLLVFEKDSTIQ
jgi:DNA-binding Xre family transcriptional regulator